MESRGKSAAFYHAEGRLKPQIRQISDLRNIVSDDLIVNNPMRIWIYWKTAV